MAGQTCARCGAEAEVVISRIEDGTPVSRSYCDGCWRVVRYVAGPIMSEGPATWGHDWAEVEEWLARNLRQVAAGPDSGAWRRLIAHDRVPRCRICLPMCHSRFRHSWHPSATTRADALLKLT